MITIKELELFEDMRSFFELEESDLLTKLNAKIDLLTEQFYSMYSYNVDFGPTEMPVLNEHRIQIASMFRTLQLLWIMRN